jgi:2-C-methyl-D-erythritol 4-phosphate cytidylyltransferase
MKKVQTKNKVVAIVPASGIGKRFGHGTHKTFFNFNGKPLIIWALETLESVEEIVEIIPVLKIDDMEKGTKLFEEYGLSKIKKISPGGKERQDSVYNGLKLIKDENSIILIHDGVRPLVERFLVEEIIRQMLLILQNKERYDGVILGVPLKDTIKESENGLVKKTLKRDSLWAIQTPQIFPYNTIISAYKKAMEERFYSTDDAGLVERYGGMVKIIMGSYRNIKITTPEDLAIAENFCQKEVRVL